MPIKKNIKVTSSPRAPKSVNIMEWHKESPPADCTPSSINKYRRIDINKIIFITINILRNFNHYF